MKHQVQCLCALGSMKDLCCVSHCGTLNMLMKLSRKYFKSIQGLQFR